MSSIRPTPTILKRLALTAGQARALDELLATLAGRLRLTDWRVRIDWSAIAADGCHAEVVIPDGQRAAQVFLGEGFGRLPADEQTETLVHELLHCHFASTLELMTATTAAVLDTASATVIATVCSQQLELVTDTLAALLTPLVADAT